MIGVVAFVMMGVVMVAVIFLFGSLLRYAGRRGDDDDDEEQDKDVTDGAAALRPRSDPTSESDGRVSDDRHPLQRPATYDAPAEFGKAPPFPFLTSLPRIDHLPPLLSSEPADESNNEEYDPRRIKRNSDRDDNNDGRFQRPVTPVLNNHYRPPSRPVTPVEPQQTVVGTTTTGGDETEHDRRFRRFDELSDAERDGVVGLDHVTVEVERARLDPLLEAIRKSGGGGGEGGGGADPVEYVVAYFDKKNDKQLSSSEKVVRKSFAIKHRRAAHTCRFARLKLSSHSDRTYYRLTFHDYTPYVEETGPRFDVSRHEIVAKERSRWVEVEASVHHNTRPINTNPLSVLVPGKRDE